MRNNALQLSYHQCREIAEQSGSNFLLAFRTLSGTQYRAITTIYAFMRRLDDIADSKRTLEEKRDRLADFRNDFIHFCNGFDALLTVNFHNHTTGIFPAVVNTIARYKIPLVYFRDVIDGVTSDLETTSYAVMDELERYCYRVASAVGLITLHVLGVSPELIAPDVTSTLKRSAIACGKALQMTNILRDVVEDAQQGRTYLPLEGLDADQLKQAILHRDEKFLRPILQKNIERTQDFYQECVHLYDGVPRESRKVLWTMLAVYVQLFYKIRRNPIVVLKKRVKISVKDTVFLHFQRFFRGNSLPALLRKAGKSPKIEEQADA